MYLNSYQYHNCGLKIIQAGADDNDEGTAKAGTVETVCVVDIRDNTPESTSFPYELDRIEDMDAKKSGGKFHPLQLLNNSGIISRSGSKSQRSNMIFFFVRRSNQGSTVHKFERSEDGSICRCKEEK